MNIAVIAANGRSGVAFVDAALAAGHHVRAGVRGTSTLAPHPNLTIIPCDATKYDDVLALVQGSDAVVSVIGHVKGSLSALQTVSTKHAVAAMKVVGIRRIISLTGSGVQFPGDKTSFIDFFMITGIKIIDRARVADSKAHIEVLQQSGLDWTLIRVSKLSNGGAQSYSLKLNGPAKSLVARKTVAKVILQLLASNEFIGQAPMVGNA